MQMRQKLSKPSNQSNISRANRQGNNNGKIFPGETKFIKSNKREGKVLPNTHDNKDVIQPEEELTIVENNIIESPVSPKKSSAKETKLKGKSE